MTSNFSYKQQFERFAQNMGRKFEPEIRYHLAKTYLCLGGTTATATLGSLLHLSGWLELGFLTGIGSILLVLGLIFMEDNGKNFYTRLGMLLGFGFCSGQTLGPFLQYIRILNPAIIVTALTGTSIVFVTLTLAALLAERGSYLFLGGILISVLNTMALISLFNMFMGSYFIAQTQLYIGLGVMSTFILYDTQAIIEKARMGSRDYIRHSLDLFFDVLSIFRKLLIILAQKEENERQNKKRN
ncbi:bax inhibitor 1 [Condylostylus longicornis]|uniref:bax inhibitor 1 n=1 Tax=Condylostylus longicornis TaxID=2530218 RepID=UPI00244E0722|nr:bax inhibitor 1 [Condylostylus longicornis]